MLVFGGACAGIASSKGRNALGWFAIGFFFGCIGLIIILCLSNVNEENARWNAQQIEQQRLREQLRQEQIKNEALRQHTISRLDKHDEHLGVDTRQTAPVLANVAQPNVNIGLSQGNEPPPPQGYPTDNWYIETNGQQDGPYPWVLVCRRARQGGLTPSTRVWAEGMENWVEASEIPTLFS